MSCYEDQRQLGAWLEGEDDALPAGIERARAAVHRNTFVGTLVEALASSFPVTRAMAGADFFDAMARERVLADPPRSPVLTEYATAFPAFVDRFEPARAAPVLAEMARLEAMRLQAFHASDAEAVGMAPFQRLACDASLFEATGVRLHPAAQWFSAGHALTDLWDAHATAEDMSNVDLRGIAADSAQDVLVHRPRFDVGIHRLPAGGVVFLDALASGASFARAFVQTASAQAQAEPATLFSLLLQQGLVIELIEISRT